MNIFGMKHVIAACTYPGFGFDVHEEKVLFEADAAQKVRLYVRVRCAGKNNRTGEAHEWTGRWWSLSMDMTEGEIVQTCFLAVQTAEEHERRENFKYLGVSVFDPHYDIEKLVAFRQSAGSIKGR